MRALSSAVLAAVSLIALSACGGKHRPLQVFAASSLTEAFPRIDPDARYSFAGSDVLAAQIRQGASADVYAAASSSYPQDLYRAGLVERPVTFASNRLVLIVPKGNPGHITRVSQVARPGTKLVLAAKTVPVGDYARQALAQLHLNTALQNVVSEEVDVKGVVGKVALGEADAGFVYATDAAAAGNKVTVIELPRGSQPPIAYQIAVVKTSKERSAAEGFVRKVLGSAGRRKLGAAGFRPPG